MIERPRPCRVWIWFLMIYHGHLTDSFQTANLYASEIGPAFERPKYLGLFHDHTTASPDNVAQMSPCFLGFRDTENNPAVPYLLVFQPKGS